MASPEPENKTRRRRRSARRRTRGLSPFAWGLILLLPTAVLMMGVLLVGAHYRPRPIVAQHPIDTTEHCGKPYDYQAPEADGRIPDDQPRPLVNWVVQECFRLKASRSHDVHFGRITTDDSLPEPEPSSTPPPPAISASPAPGPELPAPSASRP